MANCAEHSFHLTEATKKKAPEIVVWSHDMCNKFSYLKQCLCALPTLTHATLTHPLSRDSFILQIDASHIGLGAVLSVKKGKEEIPVAFYSSEIATKRATLQCDRT